MNNIVDLQNWRSGLPAAANWNVVGYNTTWHVNQVKAGHRLLPAVFLPMNGLSTAWNSSSNTGTVKAYLTTFQNDINWLAQNNVPMTLRANNIVDMFIAQRFQLPIDPANIPKSIYVWTNTNGVYNQLNLVDSFADPAFFSTEGASLGQSLYMNTLSQYYPNPPWFEFLENNEGAYDDYGRYCVQSNTNAFIASNLICTKNVRASDFILANPGMKPSQFGVTFYNNRKAQYKALYDAFNANVPAGWQNKMWTTGYAASLMNTGCVPAKQPPVAQMGYAAEGLSYGMGSKSVYIQQGAYSDFTTLRHTEFMNQIVSWKWREKHAPDMGHRELSLKFTNGAALGGSKIGAHLPMTPAHYEGYVQYLLWCMRDVGRPCLLRHWTSSTTKPTDAFFTAADITYLQSVGASNALQNATEGDYFQAVMTSVDRACEDPTLRNFWMNGTAYINPAKSPTSILLSRLGYPPLPQGTDEGNYFRMLGVDMVNTPPSGWTWNGTTNSINGTIKVWAVATIYNGQALVYAWSPCQMTGNITINVPGVLKASVPAPQPWAYYLFTPTGATQLPLTTSLISQ